MTLDEIRELIKVVTETGITELEVQRGADRVRIRRTPEPDIREVAIPAQHTQAAFSAAAAVGPTSVPEPESVTVPNPKAAPDTDPSLYVVKCPIVGTFYESPAPGAPEFVRPGDTVQPGQVLCIIESMKLMNEIEAEIGGVIVSKLVANAQPVEYGEALFTIRPL